MEYTLDRYSELNLRRAKLNDFENKNIEVFISRLSGEVGEFSEECVLSHQTRKISENFLTEIIDCYGYLDIICHFSPISKGINDICIKNSMICAESWLHDSNSELLKDEFFKHFLSPYFETFSDYSLVEITFSLIFTQCVGKMSNYAKKYNRTNSFSDKAQLKYLLEKEIYKFYIAICYIFTYFGQSKNFKVVLKDKFNEVSKRFNLSTDYFL